MRNLNQMKNYFVLTVALALLAVGAQAQGLPLAAATEASDAKPGSVLVYNFFTSNSANPASQNTELSMTNTDTVASATVHLFWINGATGKAVDAFITLAPGQIAVLYAVDIVPDVRGYAVAVAVDAATGCPVQFNHLTGEADVKLATGQRTRLGAIAFSALTATPAVCSNGAATLNFDGVSYNRAPRTVALDTIASNADGYNSLFVLNRLGGDLTPGGSAATLGNLLGFLFNDVEQNFAFNGTGGVQSVQTLGNNFPRVAGTFNTRISAGVSGWLKVATAFTNDFGVLGAALIANSNVAGYSGGGNLQTLSLANAASLTIPAYSPTLLADLSITKTHAGDFEYLGNGFGYGYELVVNNASNSRPVLGAITVTDNLPGALTLEGFTGAGWQCSGLTNITCTNSDGVAAGASLPPLLLYVKIGAGTPLGANSITNTAAVSIAPALESDLGNNSASDPASVRCPYLELFDPLPPDGMLGTPYTHTFTATGYEGGVNAFTLDAGTLPPGLTLAASGVLSGTPSGGGVFNFTVKVTLDGVCSVSRAFTLRVVNTNPGPNVSPVLPPGSPGITFNNVTTPGATTVTPIPAPAAGVTPPGFTLAGLNVAFEITTDAVFSGPVVVTFNVPSDVPLAVFNTLRILHNEGGVLVDRTILPPNQPAPNFAAKQISALVTSFSPFVLASALTAPVLAVSAAPNPSVPAQAVNVTAQVTNGGAPVTLGTLTFNEGAATLAGPLPLDANGRAAFSTNSLSIGAHSITASYSGQTYFLPQSSTVGVNVTCPTLTVSPATLPNASSGAAYNQTLSVAPAGPSTSFALTTGTLPPGLTLNGNGMLSGTPTAAGNYSFAVTATSFGACTGTRAYSLLVTGTCPAIQIMPPVLPSGTMGTPYSQTLNATGPPGAYTFSVASGALPGGLTLNAGTGVLSGTPTASGSFVITLKATSAGGCSGTRVYVLTMACATVTLAPPTLPGARAGTPYSQQLSATPAGSYSFSLLVGGLPPGLNLSSAGLLGGTTTAVGSYNFTVRAASGSCSGTRAYSIVVAR